MAADRRDWALVGWAGVLGVAAAAVLGFVVWQGQTTGLLDLRIYLGAAKGWSGGGSLYTFTDADYHLGATYPPIGLVALAPLARLDVRLAEPLWTAANLVALVAIAWLVTGHYLGLTGRRRVFVTVAGAAAAIPTAPVWTTLNQGQVNLWLWLAILADLAALRRNRRWAGILIGVATAVKLLPGLFIVFLFAVRRFGAAGRAIGAAVLATAVGFLAANADSRSYFTTLLWDSGRVGVVGDGQNNSLRAGLSHLGLPQSVQVGLWMALSVLVIVVAMIRAVRAWNDGHDLYAVVVVGCAAALVSPITWTHHLVFLVLALALLPQPATGWARWLVLGGAWLFLVDPIGFGDNWLTGGLRTAALVLVVAGFGLGRGPAPRSAAPPDRPTGSRQGRLATRPGVL